MASSSELAPRSSADSVTEMTEYVLPQHANALGSVFGGQIMAWVDLCAAICASRHSGCTAVTAFVDDLVFRAPVRVGEVVRLHAIVTATFRTSMVEGRCVPQQSPAGRAYLQFAGTLAGEAPGGNNRNPLADQFLGLFRRNRTLANQPG